jgi:hypothetical protein
VHREKAFCLRISPQLPRNGAALIMAATQCEHEGAAIVGMRASASRWRAIKMAASSKLRHFIKMAAGNKRRNF